MIQGILTGPLRDKAITMVRRRVSAIGNDVSEQVEEQFVMPINLTIDMPGRSSL